jgi:murein DD-endopeptidase MepM/ murein hydrolase activator NlpD
MILSLALLSVLPVELFGQTTNWRDMYQVKKKDTIFGIAKKYGITIDELTAANPEMKTEGYKLKKGDYIFIPFTGQNAAKTAVSTPKNAGGNASGKSADIRTRAINVGIMLPLHNVDGDGERMTEYYRGLLLAFDELRSQGVSVNVNTWNVPIDADVRLTLTDSKAKNLDLIFGPLYSKQVPALADFCKNNDIKLVIPFSITGNEVNSCDKIYQVYQTREGLNEKAISAFIDTFGPCHVVIIDCNVANSDKGIFTFGLRKRLDAKGITYNITNLKSSEDYFLKAFSKTKRNVVILNTGLSPQLNVTFAKLNNLTFNHPDLNISMFGYTEWMMYTKTYSDLFHKYDAYIPTTFYYNERNSKTKDLRNKYLYWFNTDFNYARPQFAVTGYDHGEYFLRGLHEFGKSFNGSRSESSYLPIQSPLTFVKVPGGGYMNNAFMLIHYKKDMTTDKIETK